MRKVDDLLDRIERVYVDSELSQDRMHAAIDTLHVLVAPDFGGDAVSAFTEFVEAVEQSEGQAGDLRSSVESMEQAADKVFARWAGDLEEFSNAMMRRRSQRRLEKARRRYDAIIAAVEPAQWGFEALNEGLRDHAVFLGHDFNMAAVSEIEGGVVVLTKQAAELDTKFDACLEAAEAYVRASAMPGAVEPGAETSNVEASSSVVVAEEED